MKKLIATLPLICLLFGSLPAQNQGFAEVALKNVDGNLVKLSDYKDAKGIVLFFSGIHCVYAKKYEDRILKIQQDFADKGLQFIIVNSNDPAISNEDSFERMVAHAAEKNYTFPYLADHSRVLADSLRAEKNPEAFVFANSETGIKLVYRGAIDDNPLQAQGVNRAYLREVLNAMLAGKEIPQNDASVKGCGIKRMD